MSNSEKKPLPLPLLNEVALKRGTNFDCRTYWGVEDNNRKRFDELMEEATKLVEPCFFLGDNLFTWTRNNSALGDKAFHKAWADNLQNPTDEAIVWRRYILACAAYHCLHIKGDFVECGVYAGTGIKTVMDYLGGPGFPKPYWGYDTYDYNPVEHHLFPGQQEGFYEKVQERFQDYPQVRLVKGLLPASFSGNEPDTVAFLHIDLNNAEAEIAVLERLFGRVSPGGIIILDDYEWSGAYRPQKMAEDPWFDRRRYRIFPLPTGQGIVLKR